MFNRFSSTTPQPTQAGPTSFFGSTPAPQSTSPFGGSFGSQPSAALPPSSAAPSTPYSFTNEIENGVTIKLLSISAMPAYRHLSQEEIRVDDYAKGRKGPSSFPGSQPGSFSTPFSSATNSNANRSMFSSTTSATPATGGFGSSAFGSSAAPSGSGFFGSSAFGSTASPSNAAPSTSGFGSFGSTPQTGNAFGSSPFASSTGNLGGFGSGTGTGGFGSSTPSSTTTAGFGSSAFGAPASTTKSTSGFGSSAFVSFGSTAQPTSTGLFGSTSTSTPSTTIGLFGQTPQTQQHPQQTGFGGFGQQQQQPPSTGLFGAKPATTPTTGLFGSTTTTSTGFGGFGQPQATQTQQPQQQTGFTGFGQPQQQTQPAFGGIFGSSSTNSAPSTTTGTGSGLFSSTATTAPGTGSMFGQPAQPTQHQSATTGLFGSSSTGGLFGQQPQQQQSSSLFRPAAPAQPTSQFAFGSSAPSATTPLPANTSTSLFGASGGLGGGMTSSSNLFNRPNTTTTGSTGLFGTPSISTTPATSATAALNLPIVAPAPIASGSLSLAPPLPPMYSKPSSQETSTSASTVTAPKSPVKFTPRTSFRIKPRESYGLTTPIPINFGTGPTSIGSTTLIPRKMIGISVPNIKKLVIPDFNEPSHEVPVTIPSAQVSYITSSTPSNTGNILTDSMPFGQQYTFPPIKILKTLSVQERKEIKNFVIGQKGIGEIRFLVPVDLSEIDVESIFGHLIEFCEGEAVLYPDPSIPKPEPGQGLNLPAQVRLERIWTMSKGSRDPIVDPENEKVILFTQKLKETEGTNFISYNPSTGTWTFTVDHF